jgi:DNA-binding transcriptional LysR family regulator
VSRLIADFEGDVGLDLFRRDRGRLRPTPAAERLFEAVEQSFTGLDRIIEAAKELRDHRDVELGVAGMPALSLEILPDAVARFVTRHPGARVTMQVRSSQRIVGWIASQRFDLGIAGPPYDVRGVTEALRCAVPCLCALPRGHRLASLDTIRARDLDGETLILFTADQQLRHVVDRILDREEVRRTSRVETSLSVVACRMAEQGLGIALVDPFTARFYANRDLLFRPFRPEVTFSFGIVVPSTREVSADRDALLALLRSSLETVSLPCGVQVRVRGPDEAP